MFSVALPPSLPLNFVVRTPDIYIVPRTTGPTPVAPSSEPPSKTPASTRPSTPPTSIACALSPPQLLPALADAPQLEAWAGLRPATPDGLPLLGALPGHPNHFIATGHYRNGILLAPATAHVMAQLLTGEAPSIDLNPSRLPAVFRHTGLTPSSHRDTDIRASRRDNRFSAAL